MSGKALAAGLCALMMLSDRRVVPCRAGTRFKSCHSGFKYQPEHEPEPEPEHEHEHEHESECEEKEDGACLSMRSAS